MLTIRIFVLDENQLFRLTLVDALNACSGLLVIGNAGKQSEALAEVNVLKPDIVLMDIELSEDDGIQAILSAKQKNPETQIIVLTASHNINAFENAIKAGAKAYLLKGSSLQEIVESIKLVATGKLAIYRQEKHKINSFHSEVQGDKGIKENG